LFPSSPSAERSYGICENDGGGERFALSAFASAGASYLQIRRFRSTSDSDDSDVAARSPDEPFYVVCVACEDHGSLAKGRRHNNSINDIGRPCDAK
jgi:hypothetical protein